MSLPLPKHEETTTEIDKTETNLFEENVAGSGNHSLTVVIYF